ncbi:GNAT family N-acetyltransferase [Chloroflexales bacterium ZM16-3]|nr:GNAT family N-acetyltransferase [Chloroflexales bacterium ZM16-3]
MSAIEVTDSLAGQSLSTRPARAEDLPQVAGLLAQLYEAELPGALSGNREAQRRLLQFTLEAGGGQGLRQRYVMVDGAGAVLATAAIDMPGEPPYERAPDGTVRKALEIIGLRDTVRLLLTVGRSMVAAHRERPHGSALIHSVVVDAGQRGRGLGGALMAVIEGEIRATGLPTAMIQVLQANQSARQLYRRLGYEAIWESPRYLRAIAWPTYLMRKELQPL